MANAKQNAKQVYRKFVRKDPSERDHLCQLRRLYDCSATILRRTWSPRFFEHFQNSRDIMAIPCKRQKIANTRERFETFWETLSVHCGEFRRNLSPTVAAR